MSRERPEPMQVIVGERQSGRTTKAIEWLLKGIEERPSMKPGPRNFDWTRVLVVTSSNLAKHVRHEVQSEMAIRREFERFGIPSQQSIPVFGAHEPHLLSYLRVRQREYAVDDYQDIHVNWEREFGRLPTLITIEGKGTLL